jgi:hypothetical protein
MKKKLNLSLLWIFLLFPLNFLKSQEQQQKQENEKKEQIDQKKSKEEEEEKKTKVIYKYGIFLGGDLYHPIKRIFDKDQKTFGFQIYSRIYKKTHLAFEMGHSNLNFDRFDWQINARGKYYKFGFNFSLAEFSDNPDELFYIGFRYGYSPYNQEIKKYPLRGFEEGNSQNPKKFAKGEGFSKINLSAHWLEPILGARIELFKSGFYIDAALELKFLISSIKQKDINPLVIPGFGENIDNKNMAIKWALTYKIPLSKSLK